jgi:hypothetical protein
MKILPGTSTLFFLGKSVLMVILLITWPTLKAATAFSGTEFLATFPRAQTPQVSTQRSQIYLLSSTAISPSSTLGPLPILRSRSGPTTITGAEARQSSPRQKGRTSTFPQTAMCLSIRLPAI